MRLRRDASMTRLTSILNFDLYGLKDGKALTAAFPIPEELLRLLRRLIERKVQFQNIHARFSK